MVSVSTSLLNAGYSWSASGKDRDGDGVVTKAEFMLPVTQGAPSLVPADLAAGGSLDDAFKAYDSNNDGKIDATEFARGPKYESHTQDRLAPNWADYLSAQQGLAYYGLVDRDNAALANKWGLKLA